MGYGAAATVLSCHRSSTRRSTRRSLPPCDRQLSPLQSAPHAAPSLGSPWSGGPRVSARPIREEVGASPLVRLEKAVRGRLSGHQSRQEDIYSLALCRASARGCWLRSRYPLLPTKLRLACSVDCSELRLAPVDGVLLLRYTALLLRHLLRATAPSRRALSCGHRLCRGCWVRVLQGSQARAVASRTGYAVTRLPARPLRGEAVRARDRPLALESEMCERLLAKQGS